MRYKSCKVLILFVYRLKYEDIFFSWGRRIVVVLYAIEDVMLPIHVFFGGGGIFIFAKVEC